MSDLIDREKLLSKLRQWPTPEGSDFVTEEDILSAPTVEAATVRRGRWNDGVCFDCGFDSMSYFGIPARVYTNFCPNCGADMREVENETY